MQYEKCVSMVSELEQTIRTYGTEREGRLKALEKTIKSLKSEMQSMSKQLKVAYFLIVVTVRAPHLANPTIKPRCYSGRGGGFYP